MKIASVEGLRLYPKSIKEAWEDDYISITDLVLVDLIAEFGGDTSGGRYGRSVQDAANELEAEPSGRRLIARLRELAEHAEVEELGRVVAVNVSASVENRSDDLSTTIMKSAVLFVFMNDTTETPTGTPFWLARVAKEPGAIVVLGPQGVQQLTFRSEERQKLTDKDRLLLSRAFEDEYHYVFAVLDARGKPWSADGRLTAPGLLTGSHMKLTAQVWGRMREIVSPAVPWWQFWVGEKSPHQ